MNSAALGFSSAATPHGLPAELAVVVRSGFIESRHYGSLAVVGADGGPLLMLGEPDATILPRSSVKPVQALACLSSGAPLSGATLAMAAASHTGEDEHIRVVRELLDRAGLTEDALQCPADRPSDSVTFAKLAALGETRSRLRMNCSGKHAAMLLTCVTNGWPTESYLDPDHPLQQRIRGELTRITGEPVPHVAVDGCGAPLFGTTVRSLALLFSRFVTAEASSPMGQVAAAMRAHPFYVAGTGHVNTRVMDMVPGLLAKGGAEGVIAMAAPDGTAVALKIVDGSPRATTLIALTALRICGVDVTGAAELMQIDVFGGGRPVGEIRVGAALAAAGG